MGSSLFRLRGASGSRLSRSSILDPDRAIEAAICGPLHSSQQQVEGGDKGAIGANSLTMCLAPSFRFKPELSFFFFHVLTFPRSPPSEVVWSKRLWQKRGYAGHRGGPLLPLPSQSHPHSLTCSASWPRSGGEERERRKIRRDSTAWEGKTAFPTRSSGGNLQGPSHRREPVEPDSIWSLSRLTCMHPCARRCPTLPRLHYVGGATLCGYVSAGAVAHRCKVKILGSAPGGEKVVRLAHWVWVVVG